jgi:hypothetical protein
MKLTRRKALELSIEKWIGIVLNNGNKLETFNTTGFYFGCPLCSVYWDRGCKGCPLVLPNSDLKEALGCQQDGHPWKIWYYNKRQASSGNKARKVLTLLFKRYKSMNYKNPKY